MTDEELLSKHKTLRYIMADTPLRSDPYKPMSQAEAVLHLQSRVPDGWVFIDGSEALAAHRPSRNMPPEWVWVGYCCLREHPYRKPAPRAKFRYRRKK